MNACTLCPRNCKKNRHAGEAGICGVSEQILLARAALHFWEEPCISGKSGSGTIFFSGCPLHCIYCQNQLISGGKVGKEVSVERLAEIMLALQEQGANNINLVTPDHYVPAIVKSLTLAKTQGLTLPIVYNTSSYVHVDTIKRLEGLVDVYLPDYKYAEESLAYSFSHALDYPSVALMAIDEMVRQQPHPVFSEKAAETSDEACDNVYDSAYNDTYDDNSLIKKGVVIRHLLLPGHLLNSKKACHTLYERYRDNVYLSIMSQYTPVVKNLPYPELNRRITRREYERLLDYCIDLGIHQAYIQDLEVAKESFIPAFDFTGIL